MTATPVREKTTETLIDAVHRVSSSPDLDEVMETIFDSLKELLDYSAAVICVVDSRDGVLYRLKTRGYPPGSITDDFFGSGRGVIGWVIKHKRGVIIDDVKGDERYVQARPETRSEIAAPIVRHDDKVIGGINLESDRPGAYDRRDLELLTMFASLAASAINHSLLYRKVMRQRQVEAELELARKVVDGMLPDSFPVISGLDIHGMVIPMKKVGGDYLDFLDSSPEHLGVVVADVTGNGLDAALIMVAFRAYLHATVISNLAMRGIMARINRLVHEATGGERFITSFYGLLDPHSKRLVYINAGHNPPLLVRADGSHLLLDEGGIPLGVFDDTQYSEFAVDLRAGDILVLYTDGVTEAKDTRDEHFGLERLEQIVRSAGDQSSHTICNRVTRAVQDFSAKVGGPGDDMTISVIKVM
jgi:sigma-B regulation protein RsbU (phosphoserine phosphatase)